MPNSYARVALHAVFAVKYRRRVLSGDLRHELHAVIASLLNHNSCPAIEVGSADDHVHLLFNLGRTVTIAKTLETVKTGTSKWIKAKGPAWSNFHWQDGYGVFSVWHKDISVVRTYIQNQAEHHKVESSLNEAIRFAQENDVPLDEANLEDEPERA